MCHQQSTVKIYIRAQLKVLYMQAEIIKKGFNVMIVYSRHASGRIYLADMKKRNVSRNKYGIVSWEDHLQCCL